MAAKGGFQVGQTAKARSDHRVQSLPIGDMAASTFCDESSAPTGAECSVGIPAGWQHVERKASVHATKEFNSVSLTAEAR